ncbi:MAG TPA: CAP domain-containing protein [Anaerolineaceae bacterium]|nr:CAP domain-containing protein [Anaerolineaceae bacterium]
MTRIRLAVAAVIVLVFALGLRPVQAAPLHDASCGGVKSPEVNAVVEQQVVELINQERARAGLPPLKRVAQLDDAARYFAQDMSSDDYWPDPSKGLVAHGTYDRLNGSLVYVCPWDARIKSYYSSPTGENIAAGFGDAAAAVKGWMASAGHKANILNASNWETGVGYAEGGTWGKYWVQEFGKQPRVYPLIINDEAAATGSRDVTLYVYGTWSEIRLKNDSDSWSGWQPFSNQTKWRLGSGVGLHTVYAEMRSTNASAISSDTIYSTDAAFDLVSPTKAFAPVVKN